MQAQDTIARIDLAGPLAEREAANSAMQIHITAATGCASTELAAFDRALFRAGIANFNLIKLSSVMPTGAQLILTEPNAFVAQGNWGDKLYVVLADCRTSTPNESAWAAIGWAMDNRGRGLFVEFAGASEEYVRESAEQSLQNLFETRGLEAVHSDIITAGITCQEAPVCALVAAVYASDGWG